jgi:hypothetical protein
MAAMTVLMSFLRQTMTGEEGKQSFGRVFSLPYFFSAWAIGTFAGARNAWKGESVFDDVALLAGIGFALYTGSKALSISRGKVAVGSRAVSGSTDSSSPPPF